MTSPLVSICLPNLNTRRYLEERIATILAQTYTNWELVISDNHSDDGAWEFFTELAQRDSRVSIAQAPREGLYANWNRCIERARGAFVYVATSDDTMAPNCLARLVSALMAHPECDLAHCPLRSIGEDGEPLDDWWSECSTFAESSGRLLHRTHLRMAPFDGVLHLLGGSVYVSITQLLIRRALFDRIGLFESRWGSVGDFNWNMRAGLVAHTVHVPDTWGGWRCHPAQATATAAVGSAAHAAKLDDMIGHAVRTTGALLPPSIRAPLENRWLAETRQFRAFERDVERYRSPRREAFVIWRLLGGSAAARLHAKSSLQRQPFSSSISRWLADAGVSPVLVPTADLPWSHLVRHQAAHAGSHA